MNATSKINKWVEEVLRKYPGDFRPHRFSVKRDGKDGKIAVPQTEQGRKILREFLRNNFPEECRNWACFHKEWALKYL